jgi:hypothetical protein
LEAEACEERVFDDRTVEERVRVLVGVCGWFVEVEVEVEGWKEDDRVLSTTAGGLRAWVWVWSWAWMEVVAGFAFDAASGFLLGGLVE